MSQYPEKSLERGIEQVLAMANPGDQFLCCIRHQPECPEFIHERCSCKMIEVDETTTVEQVAGVYRSAMN